METASKARQAIGWLSETVRHAAPDIQADIGYSNVCCICDEPILSSSSAFSGQHCHTPGPGKQGCNTDALGWPMAYSNLSIQ